MKVCHCATCRRRSTGAAFATFVLFRSDQVLVEGATTAFASSPEVRRHGCSACSSPLFNRFTASDDVGVHLGAFDAPERFAPASEIWTERRLPWVPPLRAPGAD